MSDEPREDEPTERVAAPSSVMEALRSKHRALIDSKTIDLQLPGYDDLLIAKYRVLDVRTEINEISTRNAKQFKDSIEQALYGSVDAMIKACVGLYTTKDDEIVPLSESFGPDEPPVKFDSRLVEFMGWEEPEQYDRARKIVFKLFENIEPMILDHGRTLSLWMTNTTRDVNAGFLGNL